MSGGSYDYFSFKLDQFIEEFERNLKNDCNRMALHQLLKLISKAIYDIEWVDSGDKGDGDEVDSINEVFRFCSTDHKKVIKSAAFDQIRDIITNFENYNKRV